MTTLTAPPPTGTKSCPKCGQDAAVAAVECPKCGVIIDKAIRAEAEAVESTEPSSIGWPATLAAADTLSIKQRASRPS